MAFSDSEDWKFEHPKTLYAWEGACIQIPCQYKIPEKREPRDYKRKVLDNLTVYHNYTYDQTAKDFNGSILYQMTKMKEFQERIQFLGDDMSNCTLHIRSVNTQDSGVLGLRMTSGTDKWMENIFLNVSSKALGMGSLASGMGKDGSGKQLTLGTGAETQVACRGQGGGWGGGRGCQ